MSYCPPLENQMRRLELIPSGHTWELQIRGKWSEGKHFRDEIYSLVPGCSIWAVELIRQEILALQPDAKVNAILIDFFLYDLAKSKELAGEDAIPHHRTRSIWY
jgi:hypothetical protein